MRRKRFARGWGWLSARHPYRVPDVISTIKPPAVVDESRMREYIVASIIPHLVDGWNYLGSATSAMLRSQPQVAIHLAYYAELRAAMALLAAEGVGIFNTRHYAIQDNGDIAELKGRTHETTWDLMTAFGNDVARSAHVQNAIIVESHTIADWVAIVNPTYASAGYTASQWLRSWSIDLSLGSRDGALRNIVSYRPTGIRFPDPARIPTPGIQEAVIGMWEVLEPAALPSSVMLDLYMLEKTLRDSGIGSKWGRYIRPLQRVSSSALWNFLVGGVSPPLIMLRAAEAPLDANHDPVPIVARALLLLRLGSGVARHVFSDAGVGAGDLRFWWEPAGEEWGFWQPSAAPSVMSDLWADVEFGIQSLAAAIQAGGPVANTDSSLTQLPRASLWMLPA